MPVPDLTSDDRTPHVSHTVHIIITDLKNGISTTNDKRNINEFYARYLIEYIYLPVNFMFVSHMALIRTVIVKLNDLFFC